MVADSLDPDVELDAVRAPGTITFVAEAPYLLDLGAPTTLIPTPIVCTTDSDGYLIDEVGNLGVTLVATDGPTNPADFTYQVTLAFAGVPPAPSRSRSPPGPRWT